MLSSMLAMMGSVWTALMVFQTCPVCALHAGGPNRKEDGHCHVMDVDVLRLPYLREPLLCDPPVCASIRQWMKWNHEWKRSNGCYEFMDVTGTDALCEDQPGRQGYDAMPEVMPGKVAGPLADVEPTKAGVRLPFMKANMSAKDTIICGEGFLWT